MLQTERLTLGPFLPSDLDDFGTLHSDEDVTRYLGVGMHGRTNAGRALSHYKDHLRRHGFAVQAVRLTGSGVLIGAAGLQRLERTGDIEVSYSLARAFWGHGYATEAAAAWVRFGFQELRLPRIVAVVVPEHARSIRVLDRLGFQYEGDAVHYGKAVRRYALVRPENLAAG